MPPELHARYAHGDALPLYQMAAKNVGIRRARGEFVLATNIDILFSDELAEYLAARRLKRGRMYRIDRHDAMSDVPVDAPVEEQLAYCATHLIRINRREGSFNVTPVGEPLLSSGDVATPDSGIVFGRGWYPLESHMPPILFRWAGDIAELHLNRPPAPESALVFDLEPAPSAADPPLQLEIEAGNERTVTAAIECRQRLQVRLDLHGDSGYPALLRLRARGGHTQLSGDPRPLRYRVFGVAWDRPIAPAATYPPHQQSLSRTLEASVEPAPRGQPLATYWYGLMHLINRLAEGGPLVHLTVPVSPGLRRLLKFYVEWNGLTGILRNAGSILQSSRAEESFGGDIFLPGTGLTAGLGWLPLDTFRGRVFRRLTGFAEFIVAPCGGQGVLYLTVLPGSVTAGPPGRVRLVDSEGRVLGEAPVGEQASLKFEVFGIPGRSNVLRLEYEDHAGLGAELKVFRCDWRPAGPARETAGSMETPWGGGWVFDRASGAQTSTGLSELIIVARGGPLFIDLETDAYTTFEIRGGGKVLAKFPLEGREVQRLDLELKGGRTHVLEIASSASFRAYSCGVNAPGLRPLLVQPEPKVSTCDFLHTNGCGDFTMLAREHWFDLRGYAEMDLFSMNLDSLFCFAAHYGGACEEVLSDPMRIYHIEHGSGSGWTPEGQAKLFERIAAKGLSFVDNADVLAMAAHMRRLGAPMIFNHEDWGMAGFELKETRAASKDGAAYRDLPA